jgi:GTP:adenosylcobinamide-phosphate guanylyltransferase
MIQKVSIGVSPTAATTNQYCVSESLSIDVPREGYVDQTRRKK